MSWPKASEEKERLLDELVEGLDFQKKRMFGAPAYFAGHSMFAGVFADDIFIRLKEEDRARFAKENKGTKGFEPMEGRRMREYIVAPHGLLKDKRAMREWLAVSRDYAASIRK